MKRFLKMIALMLLLSMCAAAVSGCSSVEESTNPEPDTINVYASFYPVYALTEAIAKDAQNVELNCIVQPQDGCLRSYQLSNWDLSLITNAADAVIIGGCGLESFENVLYNLGDNGPVVSALMQEDELITRRAANTDSDGSSHWLDPNPHMYLSAELACALLERIAAVLTLLDSEQEELFRKNLETAVNQLNISIKDAETLLRPYKGNKLIVMNEACVYATEGFGFEIDLCYERESGEDISGADLQECLKHLNKSSAKVVLIEKHAPQALCRALEGAGFALAKIDTMSTRRANESFEGYLDAQHYNAAAIAGAFAACLN